MKKKYFLWAICVFLAAGIILSSGCFKVERNNPYDPDSDVPFSEKLVKVYGTVFRGCSSLPLPGVKITIAGQSTTSDSQGNYVLAVNPGLHTVVAEKNGWMRTEYDVDIRASKNELQQNEDITMYIWYEYWENYYTVPEPVKAPWSASVSQDPPASNATIQVEWVTDHNALAMYCVCNSTWSWPTASVSGGVPNGENSQPANVSNISISMTYEPFWNMIHYIWFYDDANASMIMEIVLYYDKGPGEYKWFVRTRENWALERTITSDFTYFSKEIIYDIILNPNKTSGRLEVYNQSGNEINSLNLNFDDGFSPQITSLNRIEFYMSNYDPPWFGDSGFMNVHWVEFY